MQSVKAVVKKYNLHITAKRESRANFVTSEEMVLQNFRLGISISMYRDVIWNEIWSRDARACEDRLIWVGDINVALQYASVDGE